VEQHEEEVLHDWHHHQHQEPSKSHLNHHWGKSLRIQRRKGEQETLKRHGKSNHSLCYPNWKQQGKEPQEKEPSERVRLEMALMVRDD